MTTMEQTHESGPRDLERLTRSQAFALAGFLSLRLREHRRSLESEGYRFDFPGTDEEFAVYQKTLDFLTAAGSGAALRWPDTGGYEALVEGLGPATLAELLRALRAGAAGAEPGESAHWRRRACEGLLRVIAKIVEAEGPLHGAPPATPSSEG